MLYYLFVTLFLSYCVAIELLNLSEGSPCTRNNVTGKCVSIYNCLSSYVDHENKNYAPICSLKGKEPILCCTDCTFNDARDIVIDPNMGIIRKTGNKVRDKCIEHIHRINYPCKIKYNAALIRRYNPDLNCYEVNINSYYIKMNDGQAAGGTNARRNEYSHMALLGYGDDVTTAKWICGGTVISERFILTAGHCLSTPNLGVVKYIALGILKRSDPRELWQIYKVQRSIPHPEYKPPSKYHDIALLETDTEIKFSKDVLPACLHTTGEIIKNNYWLLTTGWGALGYKKGLADTLQAVYVVRYEEDECSKYYPRHRHLKHGYNHTIQMCYGDKERLRDTCPGDSGGPLQDYSDTLSCVYNIFGVTSSGRQCGITPGPGIYTRVSFYASWIGSIVWP